MARPGDDDGYYCRDSMCDGDHPYQGQTCEEVEAAYAEVAAQADAEEHDITMRWAGLLSPESMGPVP